MGCSICGQEDHNRRTCPNTRTCSRCGQRGHDRRTCPVDGPKAEESSSPAKLEVEHLVAKTGTDGALKTPHQDNVGRHREVQVERPGASALAANDMPPPLISTRAVVEAIQQANPQKPWHPTHVNEYGKIAAMSIGLGLGAGIVVFLLLWLVGDSFGFGIIAGIIASIVAGSKIWSMLVEPECPNCSSIAIELVRTSDEGTETVSATRADKRGGKLKDRRVRVKVDVHTTRLFQRCDECGHKWSVDLHSRKETGYG